MAAVQRSCKTNVGLLEHIESYNSDNYQTDPPKTLNRRLPIGDHSNRQYGHLHMAEDYAIGKFSRDLNQNNFSCKKYLQIGFELIQS